MTNTADTATLSYTQKGFYFLQNNLFTHYFLEVDFKTTYDFNQDLSDVFGQISSLYNKSKFLNINEAGLENSFIAKVLEILGWQYIYQDEKKIQGKIEKPDYLLFLSEKDKHTYTKVPKEDRYAFNGGIAVVLESKAYDIELDSKKMNTDNPHFQIMRYLNNLRINFGFLSNGRFWRFYDNSKLSAQKTFYEINLETIIENGDIEAFKYFYFIFNAQNFQEKSTQKTQIAQVLEKNNQTKIKIENDLKSIVYGTDSQDSIFEKIGTCIYHAKDKNISLDEVYENTLYFVFRLIFIAYFEDKFEDILKHHKYFKKHLSLQTLLEKIDNSPENHEAFVEILKIFEMYNTGEPNYDMPIFNGGLFDENKTRALKTPKVFSNADLKEILTKLFYFNDGTKDFRRDYKTLDITQIGSIYEGLLTYFFSIAQEDTYYILYAPKSSKASKLNTIEGYFDKYDYEKISKNYIIHKSQSYTKGQIYLKNTSNSRKSTASYYTPNDITSFLVKKAIKGKLSNENILHFKILDNACGSGHFLIEALRQITDEVIENFDSYPEIKEIYEKEKQAITQSASKYIEGYQPDESAILKRLLLKRVIFGIDLNPFSVELTKLSLWIDSFIFGTPLSFIEHHIKYGNALIGTTIEEFKNFYTKKQKKEEKHKGGGNLFINAFLHEFDELSSVFDKLDSLKDTTEKDIKESKRLYKEEITPTLEKLNLILNYFNAKYFLETEEEKSLFYNLEIIGIEKLDQNEQIQNIINKYNQIYHFFNYEVEFPEIIYNRKFVGFQAIVGNPPWDKMKFSDPDFFSQYKSDYRSLKNSEKDIFAKDLLAKPHIKEKYNSQKTYIQTINSYYKIHNPLNSYSGDSNIFRFFTENNFKLLEYNTGTLNYVLPSSLMFEEGSTNLRKHILTQKQLNFFYGFENRESLFRDVDQRYKFAVMQIQNCPPHNISSRQCFVKPILVS